MVFYEYNIGTKISIKARKNLRNDIYQYILHLYLKIDNRKNSFLFFSKFQKD